MYKSPIEVYTTDIRSRMDKEELVKALKYDRHQYEQGYRDAKMIAEREPHERF